MIPGLILPFMPQTHLLAPVLCQVPLPAEQKRHALMGLTLYQEETGKKQVNGAKRGEESVCDEVILCVIRSQSCKNKEQNIQDRETSRASPNVSCLIGPVGSNLSKSSLTLTFKKKKNNSQLNRYKVNAYKVRQGEYILEVCCQYSAIVTTLKNLQFVSS